MGKITQEYGLDVQGYTQYNVDFLDLYLGVDNRLFLDYNKIFQGTSPIYLLMQGDIHAFMDTLFTGLAGYNYTDLNNLLFGLHETNATCLGMSKDKPAGNSVGKELKQKISDNLFFLRQTYMNGVREIDSLYFGLEGIGVDRISDIITSIVKKRLIEFTLQQCTLLGIPTQPFLVKNVFDSTNSIWTTQTFYLPVFDNQPVIFIPKDIVSSDSGISGTFFQFIRYGFNNFFKISEDYKIRVRGQYGNLGSDLKRKEFDEYNKRHGIKAKDLSKTMLTTLDNAKLAVAFSEIRQSVAPLTPQQLIELVEKGRGQEN